VTVQLLTSGNDAKGRMVLYRKAVEYSVWQTYKLPEDSPTLDID